MPDLQPVEYDPFAPTGVQFVPVDNDPWAAGDAAVAAINAGSAPVAAAPQDSGPYRGTNLGPLRGTPPDPDWREQEAKANLAALGQPSPTAAQAAGGVLSTLGNIGHGVVNAARDALSPDLAGPAALGDHARDAGASVAAIPEQAIRGSAEDLKTMGSGQPMQSVAPATDAAMLLAGGAPLTAEKGAAGIFGGRLMKTADKSAMDEAKKMEEAATSIDQDLQKKMINSYNSRIPSVEEQYYSWAGKDHSYDELDHKSAETMFGGDEEEWPPEVRDAIQKHGSAVQISGPHGGEIFTPSSAPTRSQHMDDVVRNSEGSLMPASNLDDIMSGLDTKTDGAEGAAAEAFKMLAKSYGWDVSSGHRYFDLSRGDESLHARISDHPNLTKTNPNARTPDINIAPGAHDFYDAARILQRKTDEGASPLAEDTSAPMTSASSPTMIDAYHGTTKSFGEFTPSKGGEFGPGVYLADTPEMASYFGGREGNEGLNIIRANVALQKPFTVTKQDWIAMTRNKTPSQVQNKLKQQGYDGIIGIGSNGIDKQIIPFDTKSIQPRYGNASLIPVDHNPFAGEQ